MEIKTIDRPSLPSTHQADIQPTAPKPLRRRSKRLAPMTVDTLGEPVNLAGMATLLLHLHRKQLAQPRPHEVQDDD